MAEFVTASDITDSVLTGRVTEGELAGANETVTRLAASFGITEAAVSPMAKRLAVAVACRDCCLGLVGTDSTVQMDGSRADDIYERKYKLYAALVTDLEKDITAADFKDSEEDGEGDGGAWVRTINLQRA